MQLLGSFGLKFVATAVLLSQSAVCAAQDRNEVVETSPSGQPILRHEPKERGIVEPEEHARNLDDIETHVEKFIGPVETVFHELTSDLIHLDILHVPPTARHPYHVLVTSGVSDLPMAVPEGFEDYSRAELMIALPESWPISDAAFEDETNYWPLRWLKYIGRLPHDYDTWIGWGHTIPNDDPPQPIADTDFIGVMVSPPYWLEFGFFQLSAASGDVITFYDLIPLYPEEMNLKLNAGADELETLFDQRDIGFVLDVDRPNVARSRQ